MYLSQYYVVSSWTHGQHPQQTAAYQFERSAWKFQPAVCSSAPLNLVWNMNTTQNVIEFNHAAAHRRQRCLHGTTALSSAQKRLRFVYRTRGTRVNMQRKQNEPEALEDSKPPSRRRIPQNCRNSPCPAVAKITLKFLYPDRDPDQRKQRIVCF